MSNEDTIRVLGFGDSPKLTTGFGNVTRSIYPHLNEEFDFIAFGWMDHDPDIEGTLGYRFYPSQIFDPLGTSGTAVQFMRGQEPEVIWILADPGNIRTYTEQINNLEEKDRPAIVAYVPIEGLPINENYGVAFQNIQDTGGRVVVYCDSAREAVMSQFPNIDPAVALHGLDHMDFRAYSQSEREMVRGYVGLDDYFVVGSVGVNKRTKGHDTTIYTAAYLRENGLDDGIMFYIHTDPDLPTMGGYPLRDMAEQYGVTDMVLFKPDNNRVARGNINLGVPANTKTLEWLPAFPKPNDPEKRKELFVQYDFLSRINCMDMYLDLSQVEGWGLPQMEVMSCGVPVATVNDNGVREEIHLQAAEEIPVRDWREWATWHTGSRLVTIDPKDAAETVLKFKADKELRDKAIARGFDLVKKYKWNACGKVMVNTIREAANARKEKLEKLELEREQVAVSVPA